jgi:hypothetical protein
MIDLDATQCRRRAEACRQIVGLTTERSRKALWVTRVTYWEQLALDVEKQWQAT